ncbi:hypothetical protein [Agromyces sp. LHK192]|uniref:DUF7144 family membrane protein n=1 Tax=Agromyces sp. LHK192 TaxID=2498704 RepID=UPI000FD85355|nr:hypothetical protein [Agromyces sp. LHK192]
MTDGTAARPGGVTLVAVIAWIAGAIDMITGVLLFFLLPNESVVTEYGGTGQLMGAAIGSIIVGLITVVVAGGLLKGNSAARMIVTVLQVLSILGSLFLAVAYRESPTAWTEWVGILVSIVVLLLLWSKKASAFFRG